MNETQERRYRYLVLIPHRDAAGELRARKEALFRSGRAWARSFPDALFMARLRRPLSPEELTAAARDLRAGCTDAGNDGFITIRDFAAEFSPPPLPEDAVELRYGAPFIPFSWPVDPAAPRPAMPELRFRAGALANLAFSVLDAGEGRSLYRWKAGKAVWLPAPTHRGATGERRRRR